MVVVVVVGLVEVGSGWKRGGNLVGVEKIERMEMRWLFEMEVADSCRADGSLSAWLLLPESVAIAVKLTNQSTSSRRAQS